MKGSINTKQGYECRAVEKDELTDMDYLFYNCRQTFGEKPVEIQVPKHMEEWRKDIPINRRNTYASNA